MVYSKGLKNEFETAVVNEPSVFEIPAVHLKQYLRTMGILPVKASLLYIYFAIPLPPPPPPAKIYCILCGEAWDIRARVIIRIKGIFLMIRSF